MTINPVPVPFELSGRPQPSPSEEFIRVPIEETPIPVPEKPVDELADLFEVPEETDNDMETDDLVAPPGEETLDDLVSVSNEDIMGEAPKPKPKYRLIRRTNKRYIPPTNGLQGLRF